MLRDKKIVSIIRDVSPEYIVDIVSILREEGIDTIEVSLSGHRQGMGCIRNIMDSQLAAQVNVGAGTVTKKSDIDELLELDVRFILTPGFDENLICYALEKKLEVLPGVLTPSEVQKAQNLGIRLLKLFPADAFGMKYVKALKGPFPETDYIAVGGVNENNIRDFLTSGFQGVAIGSNLVPKNATCKDYGSIREKARFYVNCIA